MLVRENLENSAIRDKAYRVTIKLIDDNPKNLRHLVELTIPGIYFSLVQNYGLPYENQEVIDGMKDALYDKISEFFFGETEPTFTNEETYEWWENMDPSYFYMDNAKYGNKSDLVKKPETKHIFED
jgi:hypothetical protein